LQLCAYVLEEKMGKPQGLILVMIIAFCVGGCVTVSNKPGGEIFFRADEVNFGSSIMLSGRTTLSSGAKVIGPVVLTFGDLDLGEETILFGPIYMSSGSALLKPHASVRGDVILTSGEFISAAEAEIRGDLIVTSGAVTLGPRSRVYGDVIFLSGVLQLDEGAQILGDVVSSASGGNAEIVLSEGARIQGKVLTPANHKLAATTRFIGSLLKTLAYFITIPIFGILLIFISIVTLILRTTKKGRKAGQTHLRSKSETYA
jgi:cytoskeletal protein CcmA (bactofilin family)